VLNDAAAKTVQNPNELKWQFLSFFPKPGPTLDADDAHARVDSGAGPMKRDVLETMQNNHAL
jgi:hypothetical protein